MNIIFNFAKVCFTRSRNVLNTALLKSQRILQVVQYFSFKLTFFAPVKAWMRALGSTPLRGGSWVSVDLAMDCYLKRT